MKTTYLIYKQIDGTRQLVRATQEEWDAILKANRKLPPEQRRRFEMDCIEESGEMDRMYIEVNEQDYRAWQTITDYGSGPGWYLYTPTAKDYAALRTAISDYLSVFQDMEPEKNQSMGQQMM